MQIDCYGFEATSQWFKRRTLDPHLIKRSEGVTYLCFSNQLNEISWGHTPQSSIKRG